MASTTTNFMKFVPFVPLVCLCLLARSGKTFADEQGSGVVRVVVKEGDDAILPCSLSTKDNAEAKVFDWKKDGQKEVFFYDGGFHYNNGHPGQDQQFKGRVSHFQDELKYGNTSIIIRNTKVTDSGDYSCIFPHLQPRQIFNIQLVVDLARKDRSGEIRGAAAKPSINTLYQTKDGALLQCDVRGASPKPTVEWQDSAGNKLPAEEPQVSERGGSYDITLNTTVMKTDRYRCVATQEEIKHQIHTEIYMYISGAAAEPYITIVDVTEFGVLLQCDVRGASPKPTVEWQDSAGNKLPAEEPQVSERGGSFYISLQTTVTKTETNRFHCVVQQEDIGHVIRSNITVSEKLFEDTYSRGQFIGGLFGAFFLGAGILAAVLALLVATKVITARCNKGAAEQRQENRGDYMMTSTTEPELESNSPPGSGVQTNGYH